MNRYFTVLQKELKEIFRDHAAFIIVLLPVVIFPILRFGLDQISQINASEIRVSIRSESESQLSIFEAFKEQTDDYHIVVLLSTSPIQDLKDGKIDCYLLMTEDKFHFMYSSGSLHSLSLTSKIGTNFEQFYLQLLSEEKSGVATLSYSDESGVVFDATRSVSQLIAPIIFVFLVFQCSSTFANDLFAGEKERGTMELLLLSARTGKTVYYAKTTALFLLVLIQLLISEWSFLISDSLFGNSVAKSDLFNNLTLLLLVSIAVTLSATVSVFSKKMKTAQLANELVSILPLGIAVLVSAGIIRSAIIEKLPLINIILFFLRSSDIVAIDGTDLLYLFSSNLLVVVALIVVSIHYMRSEKFLYPK